MYDKTKPNALFRMALDIVEGYVIDETKPWCAPFARSHICSAICKTF